MAKKTRDLRKLPKKYRPEFNEKVKEYGKLGWSITQIAAAFDVSREMIYRWARDGEKYPGFGEALNLAREYAQAHWEYLGMQGITGQIKGFNQVAWIYTMKCRFNKDWSEVKKSEVNINNNHMLLTDEEIDKKLKLLQTKMLDADEVIIDQEDDEDEEV